MKQKTLSVFNRIETHKSDILFLYDNLSSQQLHFKPAPGEWNLLQVLRHMVTAEKQSLIYIKRKLARQEAIPKTGLGSALRHLILRIALLLPLKYKAPKIADVAEDYPDYKTMKQEWNEVRTGFNEIIEGNDGTVLSKALYRHPRAGLLNIKQALEFILTHSSHHQKQMNRIMESAGFPD